ncbi:MAG: AI-2E family transporter [Bacillota bacterium]|nr:AI-2E family transporter [Bacillota bacterium]
MKKFFENINEKWKEYALAGCVCIVFFAVLMNLGSIGHGIAKIFNILKPVIIGFVLAYIINPVAKFFNRNVFKKNESDGKKWIISVVLAMIVVLLIVGLLVASLIPQIVDSITQLADNYELYVNSCVKFLTDKGGALGKAFITKFSHYIYAEDGLITTIGDLLQDNVDLIIDKTTSIGNAAMNWAIGAIFAIYFLLAKSKIQKEFAKFFNLILSPLKYEYLMMISKKFNAIFSEYIVCEILDAVIVGAATYVFMLIANMPDALFIAVVCGITNLIPTFGPFIGGAIGGFILLLLKPSTVLAFVIWIVAIQICDGYVIKPKLFGSALDVPGVVILIAIIVFGKIMGVTGMLIAIPVAAILVYVYSELLIPKLELKKDLAKYEKESK